MSNETDDNKINSQNIENDYSRDDRIKSPNSRLSSASKKNQGQRSIDVKNSFDNETRIKSPNYSHKNTNEHDNHISANEEQLTVTDPSRSSFEINQISNDGPNTHNQNLIKDTDDDDEQQPSHSNAYIKPPTPITDEQKPNNSTIDHPSCQFRTDKKWLDLQFHPNENNDKTDEFETEKVKKPDELQDEMEDPPDEIDEEIVNRIQGSIIGMALGDALGAHVEFRPREYLEQNIVKDLVGGGTWGLLKGQFTDDTSMALCLANSLLARRDFIPYDQLVRYKWWSKYGYMSSTGQCFDIGAATSISIHEFTRRQKVFAREKEIPLEQLDNLSDVKLLNEFDVYCSDEDAAGNGALMRLAPVPLFFFRNKYAAVEFSGRSGQITHGDKKAYDACRFYGALIVAALRGWKKKQILASNFYSKHRHWFGNEPLDETIIEIAKGSYKKPYGYEGGIRGKGYIVSALEAALWAFWSDGDSFEKGALAAVNLGDDTDTTAAIYGQLAGAYYGYKKLPKHWLEHVYALKFMKTLSKWIAYEGEQWDKNRENSFTEESRSRH